MTARDEGDALWRPLEEAIASAASAGRTVDLWLRDDDAVTRTAALDRLAALARRFAVPVLLAVIPEPADEALAAVVADTPLFTPAQHGWAHANHAPPGGRACELGGSRPPAAVRDDLARGRARLQALLGEKAADVLVPPWNRIAPALLPELRRLGFEALSTFADSHADATDIPVVNCDLDIIDWRHGRVGRDPGQLAGRLAALVPAARPLGILTHHLAHDDTAWRFLDQGLDRLRRHPNVRFLPFDAVRSSRGHRTRRRPEPDG